MYKLNIGVVLTADVCACAAPLRGIPSRLPSGGFTGTSNLSRLSAAAGAPASRPARTPAGRKEGRVKMLDINEQSIGFQAQQQQGKNKRKKLPGESAARSGRPAITARTECGWTD